MNRSIKRVMERKQIDKRPQLPSAMDNSKFMEHIEKRKIFNDGLTVGFVAAIEAFTESAKKVRGIGDYRVSEIQKEMAKFLEEYRRKMER